MFNKLVSNLPFNPSLINQVSFYARRLKAETTVRRLGFGLVALTLFLQMFAVFSPAQPSLARTGNDIIPGGVTSTNQIYQHCLNNDYGLRNILAHFGISCKNVANNSSVTTIRSTDNGDSLYSMGRLPVGPVNGSTGKVTNEVPIKVAGIDQLFYMRKLSSWDGSWVSSYKALSVGNAFGVQYFILFSCGNIVQKGQPAPPPTIPPPPKPQPPPPPPVIPPKEISCSNLGMSVANGARVNIGTVISVRGQASGKNIPAGQLVSMRYDLINASTHKIIATFTEHKIPFRGTIANAPAAHNFTLKNASQYRIKLTVNIAPSGRVAPGSGVGNCLKTVTVQRPCEGVVSKEQLDQCLSPSKRATNVTQKIDRANGTTAKAGDTLIYSLMLHNSATVPVKATVTESMGDVMEYANIVDMHGGSLNSSTKIVSWPAQTIPAKTIITHKITVKVKDPIPQTPAPCPADGTVSRCVISGSFDLLMTNVYGNTINIKLPKSRTKITEITSTQTLPNTGPGASIIMVFGITVVAGYFFARSRVLANELDIIRKDYASSGGM